MRRGLGEPHDHALGRSRGGFTIKLHLVTDGTGLPLGVVLSAGQDHESQYVARALDAADVPRRTPGRRRRRTAALAGDKGYSCPQIRRWLRQHHVRTVIPERSDQVRHRAHHAGRKPTFDRAACRRRHVIGNCVGWLKEARGIATRYEKLAIHYSASSSSASSAGFFGGCAAPCHTSPSSPLDTTHRQPETAHQQPETAPPAL